MIALLAVVHRVLDFAASPIEATEAAAPQAASQWLASERDEDASRDTFSWLEIIVFSLVLFALTFSVNAYRAPLPANLDATSANPGALRWVQSDTRTELVSGYDQKITAGTTWQHAGRVEQGDVFRPLGKPFILAGSQGQEAWLVLKDGVIAGFYLPAEQRFTALSRAVPLATDTKA